MKQDKDKIRKRYHTFPRHTFRDLLSMDIGFILGRINIPMRNKQFLEIIFYDLEHTLEPHLTISQYSGTPAYLRYIIQIFT